MDGQETTQARPMRRRRKPTKMEIFKQTYLPLGILAVAATLILIFTIGSITRAVQRAMLDSSTSQSQAQDAEQVYAQAKAYADGFDYEEAIMLLENFSGKKTAKMNDLEQQCRDALDQLVLWEDNNQVLNLAFDHLAADPSRAFASGNYDSHLTTSEFTKILQQLYENGYILVSLQDLAKNVNGDLAPKDLYLPEGKKPLIITQTGVNYYTKMVDSDGDKFPDEKGAGFASRLLLDENGNLACELYNSDGTVTTGAYDLVPILEAFITTHPDFSYKGARAVLAVTGYDGVFGYRSDAASGDYFGPAYRDKQSAQAATIANKLRSCGYEFACMTYNSIPYGSSDLGAITADLTTWNDEVAPIIGKTDILVFAANSDIAAAGTEYEGEKFTLLSENFSYFVGYNETASPWIVYNSSYMCQGRMTVSSATIKNSPDLFAGLFDAASILEPGR